MSPRKILVTSALPYANGPIHLGHLVEYVQTDIWARYHKLRGRQCYHVCADDAHGTPIMLKAEQEGIPPEALIERVYAEHRADFTAFGVEFDNYHSTHSEENRYYSELIYDRLRKGGHIVSRTIPRPFDPVKGMFLPDRYIRGECPRCRAPEQYGDSCEVCGATYTPMELGNPVSVVSNSAPVLRDSEQLFVRLGDFSEALREWVQGVSWVPGVGEVRRVQPEIANKLGEWFSEGLQDWDISRNAPYFGFEIPDAPGKYFYVWLDAPIGYMASFRNLCDRLGEESPGFDAFWSAESEAELYHFVGKDIAYFHTLFWPAELRGGGFRMPSAVFCHGFLTVDGERMSKSRGTFIEARKYRAHLDPEYLRYYFACKIGAGIEDMDLNLDDFVSRVNADLVGKLVNIASRSAGFIQKGHGGRLARSLEDPALYDRYRDLAPVIAGHYEGREFGRAMREIMALADLANQYIDGKKPWILAREAGQEWTVQAVCTMGINLFRALTIYLKPVVPALAARAERFLGQGALGWEDLDRPLLGRQIAPFEALLRRVERSKVAALVEASKETLAPRPRPGSGDPEGRGPTPPSVQAGGLSLEAFEQVDLRVGRVLSAEPVEGADRLLRLNVDLGGERRTIISGIREAYTAESLIGRDVVVVANLEPRKMRFGISEGMLLTAEDPVEGGRIRLLEVERPISPGAKIR